MLKGDLESQIHQYTVMPTITELLWPLFKLPLYGSHFELCHFQNLIILTKLFTGMGTAQG